MKLNGFAFLVLLSVLMTVVGCVRTVDGRSRMGFPGKDTIEARYERPPMEIWNAAKDVLAYNGTLYTEDTLKSTLQASVNTRTVWVYVVPLNSQVTQVMVQARTKGGFTDLELAGEIDKQIAIRLAAGRLSPVVPPGNQ